MCFFSFRMWGIYLPLHILGYSNVFQINHVFLPVQIDFCGVPYQMHLYRVYGTHRCTSSYVCMSL